MSHFVTCLWKSIWNKFIFELLTLIMVSIIISVTLPGFLCTGFYGFYPIVLVRQGSVPDWSFCPPILEYSVAFLCLFSRRFVGFFFFLFCFTYTFTYIEHLKECLCNGLSDVWTDIALCMLTFRISYSARLQVASTVHTLHREAHQDGAPTKIVCDPMIAWKYPLWCLFHLADWKLSIP